MKPGGFGPSFIYSYLLAQFMVSRSRENYREGLRKEFAKDLTVNARIFDSPLLLRHVDEAAVNKARLSFYDTYSRDIRKMSVSTGDYNDMEKARDTKHECGLDARDFGLDQQFEQEYFEFYGHGYNGSPVVDKIGAPYKCPCGVSMEMTMKAAPEYCPVCHRITPLGELVRDKWGKRH